MLLSQLRLPSPEPGHLAPSLTSLTPRRESAVEGDDEERSKDGLESRAGCSPGLSAADV